MRYSDAAEKYYNDTKKRIFENVIAAAENGDDRPDSTTEKIVHKKEHITMSRTENKEKYEIRRNKGAIAAAVCAVMILGGGGIALNKMNTDTDTQKPATAAEQQVIVEDPGPAEPDTAPATESYQTFEEYINSYDLIVDCDFVQEGIFVQTGDEMIPIKDFEGGEYDLVAAKYVTRPSGTVFKGSAPVDRPIEVFFDVAIGDADPAAMTDEEIAALHGPFASGDKYLFMADLDDQGYMVKSAEYFYDNSIGAHRYCYRYSLSGPVPYISENSYDNEVTQYVLDSFKGRDLLDFQGWIADHGLEHAEKEEYSDTVEKGKVIGVEWSDEDSLYHVYISKGDLPEEDEKPDDAQKNADEKTDDSEGKSAQNEQDGEEQIIKELEVFDKGRVTEGFDGYEIEIGRIGVTNKNNIQLFIKVTEKGNAASYDPSIVRDAIYNDLEPVMSLMGAKEIELSCVYNDVSDPANRNDLVYSFTLSSVGGLDLDKIDGTMSVPFGINTIKADGSEASGNFEAQIRLDMSTAR